jgi:DNA-binding MarR family transcriptional regulator
MSRKPHPTDRRATLGTLTSKGKAAIPKGKAAIPKGNAAIRSLIEGHEQLAGHLFGHLPAEQLAVFTATLDQTIATFARSPGGSPASPTSLTARRRSATHKS